MKINTIKKRKIKKITESKCYLFEKINKNNKSLIMNREKK